MSHADTSEVQVSERVQAAPATVYEMVSDVTRMGDWSPETTSCRWLGDATGPAVGARFRGTNRKGWRKWSTKCTVVEAEPGRRFAFDVDFGPLPVSRWTYEFIHEDGGTRVVETWTDRRPGWMDRLSPAVMGVRDRGAHNRAGMEQTLAKLREVVRARS